MVVLAGSAQRIAFRVAITVYAASLVAWLLLGLLPPLADHVAAVHHAVVSAAGRDSLLGSWARRVLHPETNSDLTNGTQTVVQYAFSALNLALGLLLVLRRPDDTVPRLLGFALFGTAATFNLPSHRAFHILGSPWPVAAAHFSFHIVSGVTYIWAVLLFPDGLLPRRIRLGPRATAWAALAVTAVVALISWRSSFLAHPQFFMVFFGIAVPVLGIAAQLLRLRDPLSTGTERRTARTLTAALLPALATAAVWVVARLVATLGSGATVAGAQQLDTQLLTWFPVAFAVVPAVLFAAVLRYRLWDIDRWLTRVLIFGVLTLVIGAVYVLAVVVGGELAGAGRLWTLVLALSVAAAVVEPLRRAARRWANRVVFGVSLSPEEALRVLNEGLAQLTPAAELEQLVSVAARATRASSASLWLVDGPRLVRVASASRSGRPVPEPLAPDAPPLGLVAAPDAQWLAAARRRLGAGAVLPVQHQGELLGVLAVDGADGTELPAADRAMLVEIADHAGLLVHNAVLTIGLARQAEERAALSAQLRRARRRLVAAQDAERHRMERNLHDGAQQALVAALIGLRGIDPSRPDAPARVAALQEVLATARASLAELIAAERPASLDRDGLVAALDGAAAPARGLGPTVEVVAEGVDDARLDPEIAAAVYFSCLEAVQNAVKHAEATTVRVELAMDADELRFAVTDDGAGFDVASAAAAGGLRRLDERLAVVGGSLAVATRLGGGTRVAGRVPVHTAAALA